MCWDARCWVLGLGVRRGSLLELRTQITISSELGFLLDGDGKIVTEHACEVGCLLNGLITRFQSLA